MPAPQKVRGGSSDLATNGARRGGAGKTGTSHGVQRTREDERGHGAHETEEGSHLI